MVFGRVAGRAAAKYMLGADFKEAQGPKKKCFFFFKTFFFVIKKYLFLFFDFHFFKYFLHRFNIF